MPVSSWAFWGGFLSNATEIHVNAPPHHQLMSGLPQYIYHNEGKKTYFGRQSKKYEFDIDYEITLIDGVPTPLPSAAPMVPPSSQLAVLTTIPTPSPTENTNFSKFLEE